MNNGANIEHTGRVVRIADGKVFVSVVSGGACGSCRARKACGMGEEAEKIVEVESSCAADYAEGDEVVVSVKRHTGMKAVLLAYALPVVLLMLLLTAAKAAGAGDGVAAAVSLCGVAAYYAVLFLVRGRIADGIKFTIHKI